ncbi:MAG: hypothetical protein V3U27_21410 [Candidatus Tectomicrobia bacterium]
MTHTPGPWMTIPPDRCIYHADGKRVVAVAQHDFTEIEANARLIASAPALLAALESFTYSYDDDAAGDLQIRMEAIIEQARAAITDAKGETQ